MSDKIEEPEHPHGNRAAGGRLHPVCSLTLDEPRLREIICFLKHSGMKLHAVWLARRFTEMDVMETKRWVEALKHPLPVSVAGMLRNEDKSENDLALAQRGLGRSVAEEKEGSSHE